MLDPHIEKSANSKIWQTADAKTVRRYTGDLTPAQKLNLQTTFSDDYTLAIAFKKHPTLSFTIRRQDLFNSGAQVIVNAANTYLGGGGGIDGAIHNKGGADYANAHRQLQATYQSNYVSGHAAMIESGSLKNNHMIDNVIVVAGPQGDSTVQKENELYSCYYNSLLLAHHENKTSIAFPSISTGIFSFPRERAASISLKAVQDFANNYPDTDLKTISIHFLATDAKSNLEIYAAASAA